jgi:hypothetical protein
MHTEYAHTEYAHTEYAHTEYAHTEYAHTEYAHTEYAKASALWMPHAQACVLCMPNLLVTHLDSSLLL